MMRGDRMRQIVRAMTARRSLERASVEAVVGPVRARGTTPDGRPIWWLNKPWCDHIRRKLRERLREHGYRWGAHLTGTGQRVRGWVRVVPLQLEITHDVPADPARLDTRRPSRRKEATCPET